MGDADIEQLRERHDDVPEPDDFEESLRQDETHRRRGGVRLAKEYGQSSSKAALAAGLLFSLYTIAVKLPLVIVGAELGFVSDFGDPVAAAFLFSFGLLWASVGLCHIYGAWSFYRLRRLQNAPARRAAIHGIRGAVVVATGAGVAGVTVAYIAAFTALL